MKPLSQMRVWVSWTPNGDVKGEVINDQGRIAFLVIDGRTGDLKRDMRFRGPRGGGLKRHVLRATREALHLAQSGFVSRMLDRKD